MNIEAIQKAYRRYARFYDLYFGMVFHRGRKAVIDKMNCQSGEKILEVGVGTGLSLPLYPEDIYVTGIDISPEMLKRAEHRKARDALDNVLELRLMDAEQMQFSSNEFDKVVAAYVVPVVSDPKALVAEMCRVCKPDGELFIVNHFQSQNSLIRRMEHLLSPFSEILGFRTDLSLDSFIRDAELDVIERSGVNLFGYWTMLRARNNKQFVREELMPMEEGASFASG